MPKYRAFISYRHRPLDIAAAKAVQAKLETFRIPSYISKKDGVKKLGRCFRDQDELPTSSNLADSIVDALENSEWLIVICTPALSESKWCLTEIETFIKLHGRDRVLAVLAEGEPQESFPSLLRFETLEDGTVIEREPLAADIRDQIKKKLKIEKLRLIAPMLGVGFDDLRRRARERFMKTVVAASLAGAVVFAGFGSFAVMQSIEIARQRDLARQNEERAVAGETEAKARGDEISARQAKMYVDRAYNERKSKGNPAGAAVLALKALEYGTVDGQVLPDVRMSLHYAAGLWDYTPMAGKPEYRYKLAGPTAPAPMNTTRGEPLLNSDGTTFLVSSEISARLYNIKTMKLIREYVLASECIFTKQMNDGYVYNLVLPVSMLSADKTKAIIPYTEPIIIDMTSGDVLYKGMLTEDMLEEFGFERYFFALDNETNQGKDVLYDRLTGEVKAEWQMDSITVAPMNMRGIYDSTLLPDNSRYLAYKEWLDGVGNTLQIYKMPEMELVYSITPTETSQVLSYYLSPDQRHMVIILGGHLDADYDHMGDYRRTGQVLVIRLEDSRVIADYAIDCYNDWAEVLFFESDRIFSPDGTKIILPFQYLREEREEKVPEVLAGIFDLTVGRFVGEPISEFIYTKLINTTICFTPDSGRIVLHEWIGRLRFYDANNGSLIEAITIEENYTSSMSLYISGDAEALLFYDPGFTEVDWIGDTEDEYSSALYYLAARDDVDYMSHIFGRDAAESIKEQEAFELVQKLIPDINTYTTCNIGANGTRGMLSRGYYVEIVDMDSGKFIFERELKYNIFSDVTGYKYYHLADISANANRFVIGQLDTLYYYDAADGALLYEKQMDIGRLKDIGISPDGKVVFVLSDKGVLVFLNAEDGSEITRQYYPHLGMNYNGIKFQFTPDSKYLYGDKGIDSMKIDNNTNMLESMWQKDGIMLFEAKTGEFVAAHLVDPIPASMQPEGGEIIYLDDTYTLRLPPIEETIAAVRETAREYEFKLEDKLRYNLD